MPYSSVLHHTLQLSTAPYPSSILHHTLAQYCTIPSHTLAQYQHCTSPSHTVAQSLGGWRLVPRGAPRTMEGGTSRPYNRTIQGFAYGDRGVYLATGDVCLGPQRVSPRIIERCVSRTIGGGGGPACLLRAPPSLVAPYPRSVEGMAKGGA
eukprot:279282-Rhodomonas_salina.1